jgi:hypothetical protein
VEVLSWNESECCLESNPWNCCWVMSDKTCLDLMVGLGNKYPKQLLNSAVHKVLFSDSTVKL